MIKNITCLFDGSPALQRGDWAEILSYEKEKVPLLPADIKRRTGKVLDVQSAFSSHPYTCSCHAQIIIERTRKF